MGHSLWSQEHVNDPGTEGMIIEPQNARAEVCFRVWLEVSGRKQLVGRWVRGHLLEEVESACVLKAAGEQAWEGHS